MTFILCPIIAVLCAAGSPDCQRAKDNHVHGQMKGMLLFEDKKYLANFVEASKHLDYIGDFTEVVIPKKDCTKVSPQ